MNRPIRGPAFVELDEVTGLLRPGSLAKLLHPDPVEEMVPERQKYDNDQEYQP